MASNGRSKRPVFSKRYFPVEIAIFEHKNEDGRLNHSIKLTRTFRRDEESEWEQTEYLATQDLLPARELISEAFAFIQGRLQAAYDESRDAEPAGAGNF